MKKRKNKEEQEDLSPEVEYQLRYLAEILVEIYLTDMSCHNTSKGIWARKMLNRMEVRKTNPYYDP
jgi:hypothetical protein